MKTNSILREKILPGCAAALLFLTAACQKNGNERSSGKSLGTTASANWFVDGTNGDDNNDGKSPEKAWKTIGKSMNAATPGTTVAIRGGTYQEELTLQVSGTENAPILFTNYNKETVIIDGSKNAGPAILTITDRNYCRFSNLIIQNRTVNGAQGVLVTATAGGGSTGLEFRHITIRNISWSPDASQTPNKDQNAQGFIAFGYGASQANTITRLLLDSCEIYSNTTGFSEAVSVDGNIDGFSITHCLVHDNSNIGIAAEGNYGVSQTPNQDQARNGIISNNTCYNNIAGYATSGGIYVDGGRDIRVSGNLSYGNGYGIEIGNEKDGSASNILVIDNILFNNQITGLALGGYDEKTTGQVLNCTIRNNTFWNNNPLSSSKETNGEMLISKASGCIIANNIFFTADKQPLFTMTNIAPQANNTLDYNSWFTPSGNPAAAQINWSNQNYSSWNSYQTGTGQEAHSIFADPLFTNPAFPGPDLHLRTGSPALLAGNPALVTPDETDFDGKPRLFNGKIDMGAYQKAN